MPVNPNISVLFRLFAVAFRPPARGSWMDAVTSGSLAHDIETTWRALMLAEEPLLTCLDGLKQYEGADAERTLHALRIDETRLFVGENPLVENSEGTWLQREHGVKTPIRMINRHTQEVADFMRACGVARRDKYNDCIDYIENELDFCGYLASDPQELRNRGIDPLEKLDEFAESHLQKWVPGFCMQVAEEAGEPYYPAVCAALEAFVKEF